MTTNDSQSAPANPAEVSSKLAETPETDAALNAHPKHHSGVRLLKLCDRLERERDEARQYCNAMYPYWPAQKPLHWLDKAD